MNCGDRMLQRWRIRKAQPYLAGKRRVLDIGCADGALLKYLPNIEEYVGVDPDLSQPGRADNALFIKGFFPKDISNERPFDAITLLATFEHFPPAQQQQLATDCERFLKPGGQVIMTVPSPAADGALEVLRFVRIIDGMSLEEHSGIEIKSIPALFTACGLLLLRRESFELGFNNLFVFGKPTQLEEKGVYHAQ